MRKIDEEFDLNSLTRLNRLPSVQGISDEGVKRATFYFNEVFSSLRPNTRRAYKSDFEKYASFMNEVRPGLPAFTADEDVMKGNIQAYADFLLQTNAARTTIARNLNIISQVSNSMRIPNPYRDDRDFKTFISNTISNGLAQAHRKQAVPVTINMMEKIVRAPVVDDLSLRNMTMANLAWDSLCRASEIAMAKWDFIEWDEAAILVPESKSNKSGDLDYRFLSTTTLDALSRLRAITPKATPYIFNPLKGVSTITLPSRSDNKTGLSYKAIVTGLRSALSFAGIPEVKQYSGHSFRVGAALEMKRNNVSDGLIQSAGGWKDGTMPNYYTRKLEASQSGAARLARLHNR